MAKIIAVSNQKGGTAKTTTSLAIAEYLKIKGKRVLLVDTDAQRNSTFTYKAQIENQATVYDLLLHDDDTTVHEAIQHTEFGDIIAADEMLRDIDSQMPNTPFKFRKLRNALNEVREEYDFIIIDTPPQMGTCLGNVLIASDYIIVPATLDIFSSQGLLDLHKTISLYQKEDNPNLRILGILPIRYKQRQLLTKDINSILVDLAEKMGTKVFDTKIRESVRCQEAQAMQIPLFTYASTCSTAEDYAEFVEKELLGEER